MSVELQLQPAPGAAPLARRWAAQAAFETRTLLTNGEQLLLTLVIPIAVLVAVVAMGLSPIAEAVPGVLTLSVLSSAFTALAISTGFERRSGVLKFLGTTPLARHGLLAGKVASTLAVLACQWALLLTIAVGMGWRPVAAQWPTTILLALLGTAALGSWGFLLAGVLRAEATLAIANGIFLLLLFAGGTVLPADRLPGWLATVVSPLPTAALHRGLTQSLVTGGTPIAAAAILLAWAVVGSALAARYFRWE